MKASILGLTVATVAFAGSSVYLWTQLQAERAQALEVTERTRLLNERLTELERARGGIDRQRPAAANPFAPGSPSSTPAANPDVAAGAVTNSVTDRSFVPSAAHQKMMRAQFRAANRRNYAGLGEELGLSKEKEKALIDLLSDQQLAGIPYMLGPANPETPDVQWQEKQRADQAQIVDLLGTEKAEALSKYQESLPARREVDVLSRQLEGSDAPLSADQEKRLVTVFSEERARVPRPEFERGTDEGQFAKRENAWQSDYEQRVNARTRGILNTEQYNTYAEYQEWQAEMREEFSSARPTTSTGGDSFFVIGSAAVTAPTVAIQAPAPDSPKEK